MQEEEDIMPIMTDSRFFAEAIRGHGVSHLFFCAHCDAACGNFKPLPQTLVTFYHLPFSVGVGVEIVRGECSELPL